MLIGRQLHGEANGICELMVSAHNKTRGRWGDSATILWCFRELQHRFHRRLDHTCDQCPIVMDTADAVEPLSGGAIAVSSSRVQKSQRQQAACLSCRETKQKCSKGVPW
jgi:hypothetical protein